METEPIERHGNICLTDAQFASEEPHSVVKFYCGPAPESNAFVPKLNGELVWVERRQRQGVMSSHARQATFIDRFSPTLLDANDRNVLFDKDAGIFRPFDDVDLP